MKIYFRVSVVHGPVVFPAPPSTFVTNIYASEIQCQCIDPGDNRLSYLMCLINFSVLSVFAYTWNFQLLISLLSLILSNLNFISLLVPLKISCTSQQPKNVYICVRLEYSKQRVQMMDTKKWDDKELSWITAPLACGAKSKHWGWLHKEGPH